MSSHHIEKLLIPLRLSTGSSYENPDLRSCAGTDFCHDVVHLVHYPDKSDRDGAECSEEYLVFLPVDFRQQLLAEF